MYYLFIYLFSSIKATGWKLPILLARSWVRSPVRSVNVWAIIAIIAIIAFSYGRAERGPRPSTTSMVKAAATKKNAHHRLTRRWKWPPA